MMDLINAHGVQLAFGLLGALTVFVASYALPERYPIALLILMVPFQLIASRYGSLNVGMVYLTFAAFLFQGRMREVPYLLQASLLVLAYLLSMATSIPTTYGQQGIYLFNVFSSFVFFYLLFNHFRRFPDPRFVLKLLIGLDVAVLLFFAVQITLGFDSVNVLGLSEWSIGGNLENKGRLLGPFGPAGTNAGFLVLQCLIMGYALMRFPSLRMRVLLIALLFANVAMLIATGSRGGFIALIFGTLLFLTVFRRTLGTARVVSVLAAGGAAVAVAGVIIVAYTPFDTLFTRLAGTEFTGVVPDSRRGWFYVIERIPEALTFGHGPRIVLEYMSPRFLREVYIGYPHNLYLFLLYSLGLVGFIVWMVWFASLGLHWLRASRWERAEDMASEFPRLGVVVLLTFLFDSMKIEFLRFQVVDYQHYVFALLAIFSAFSVHSLQHYSNPVATRLATRPDFASAGDPFTPAGALSRTPGAG
ncbi:MAG: O-antigen ligase family protein [Pseudomonadota bacterium]